MTIIWFGFLLLSVMLLVFQSHAADMWFERSLMIMIEVECRPIIIAEYVLRIAKNKNGSVFLFELCSKCYISNEKTNILSVFIGICCKIEGAYIIKRILLFISLHAFVPASERHNAFHWYQWIPGKQNHRITQRWQNIIPWWCGSIVSFKKGGFFEE